MRHLDHIVWPTRNLAALAETFRRLGFTVGRRNRHPWGTENHIVQFDGAFLELLGFAEDYWPVPPDDPAFPFARFCADDLAHGTGGAAMLVLRSDDAAADAADFRARGLGAGHLLPFSRSAQGPDGSDRTVAFTVAFAELPGLPEIGAFTCQHRRPENFWNPAAQRHPNGALGLGAVVIEARQAPAAVDALRAFVGSAEQAADSGPAVVALKDSRLEVVQGCPAERSRIAALHVQVSAVAEIRSALDAAGVSYALGAEGVTVAAAASGGTDLVFVTG